MWRPAERIHFEPSAGRIPTREQAAHSKLFSPLRVGRLNLAQRTWVPAMVPWRATEEGEVTDAVIAWYERFARGKPGAIVVEATGVRDVPSGPLLRIGHDRYVEGLQRLVEAVQAASGGQTKLFIQIIDFLNIRRRPDPAKYFERFLAITEAHRRAVDAEGLPDARSAGAARRARRGRLEERADGARARIADAGLSRARHRSRSAAHSRSAASAAASVRGGGATRGSRGLRRRRTALRARLYDGLVPVAHQHARRRLRRRDREPVAAAARSVCGDARGGRRRVRRRLPLSRRRMHRGRQRRR